MLFRRVFALSSTSVMSLTQAFITPTIGSRGGRAVAAASLSSLTSIPTRIEDSNDDDTDMKHQLTYSVTGTGRGNAATMINSRGQKMSSDIPNKFAGTDTAPTPVEMLLGALIGCEQATAMYVSRSMTPRLLIDKIDFDLEVYRDARGAMQPPIEKKPDITACPRCVSGTVTVFLKGNRSISPDQLQLLVEQTEARCPVANMMASSGCIMNISWVDGNAV